MHSSAKRLKPQQPEATAEAPQRAETLLHDPAQSVEENAPGVNLVAVEGRRLYGSRGQASACSQNETDATLK